MKVERGAKSVLKDTVRRVESHPATPGSLDKQGRDWNCDTLSLFMESGKVVQISGGCHGIEVHVRDDDRGNG